MNKVYICDGGKSKNTVYILNIWMHDTGSYHIEGVFEAIEDANKVMMRLVEEDLENFQNIKKGDIEENSSAEVLFDDDSTAYYYTIDAWRVQ